MSWLARQVLLALSKFFKNRVGQWITAILLWLGLTYGTQKVVVGPILEQIHDYLNMIPSAGGQWGAVMMRALGIFKLDIAFTMITSAIAIRTGISATKVRMYPAVGRGTGY